MMAEHGWSGTGRCVDGPSGFALGWKHLACFRVEQHEGCLGQKRASSRETSESPRPLLSGVAVDLFILEEEQGEGAGWKEEMSPLHLWRGTCLELINTIWIPSSLWGCSVLACGVTCTPAF